MKKIIYLLLISSMTLLTANATGQKARVTITSGSDKYSVVSSNPDFASARTLDMILDVKVEIRALHTGEATITVMDEKSGQRADIHVVVDNTYYPEGTVWGRGTPLLL